MIFNGSNVRLFGTMALLSLFVSGVTSFIVVTTLMDNSVKSNDLPLIAAQTRHTKKDVLDCNQLVYSPVQNKWVSQDVFDEEMIKLFAALGIDTSIYSMKDKR